MAKDDNWSRRDEMCRKAREHTSLADRTYPGAIKDSVESAELYEAGFILKAKGLRNKKINITVVDMSSTEALYNFGGNGKTAILDFASYKNPGGKFFEGSSAQEESLCHESFLYNVLRCFSSYYEWNQKHLNRALYTNRALYIPDVCFAEDERDFAEKSVSMADVIVCAAPNFAAARKYQNVSEKENYECLKSRCAFVLDVAQSHHVETLILGAYGCGVFGQDPEAVAYCFKNLLNDKKYTFDGVIFPIPDNGNGNYQKFADILR